MKKYAERIERNEINPHFRYDGNQSGLILNPLDEDTPLELLGFGIYQLDSNSVIRETEEKEIVFVPQNGEFEVELRGKKFCLKREKGPFPKKPKMSSASALYIPCHSKVILQGQGEIAFFEAPAFEEKSPFFLSTQDVKVSSRGEWVWRREVATLITPQDASSNLVVGETYSPPGFWSGTPVHKHDKDQPSLGESDHEEIYYFRFREKIRPDGQFGPYGVQILMDEVGLKKAYLIEDRSVVAIPGGCHPVVTSPVSDLLYLWGLAGRGNRLVMRDLPEFIYLKYFEEIFKKLDEAKWGKIISQKNFQNLCSSYPLTDDQINLLILMLREKGFEFE